MSSLLRLWHSKGAAMTHTFKCDACARMLMNTAVCSAGLTSLQELLAGVRGYEVLCL